MSTVERQANVGLLSGLISKLYLFLPTFHVYPFSYLRTFQNEERVLQQPLLVSNELEASSQPEDSRKDLLSVEKGRIMEDKFVTSDESQRLKALGMAALRGQTNTLATPFSYQVPYLGMTYPSAVIAADAGNISSEDAKLFLSVSEKIRQHLVSTFKLKTPLYHHFTHIVCRSPNVEAPLVSEGKYLPAHSDSCWLNVTTGTCDYGSGASTWRHFTSLLYLHEDFTGGDFFFSQGKHNITPEVWVRPQANRMLAFTAGEENIHGVTHTLKGVRCILEQWFTIDSSYRDHSFDLARKNLNR
jgi:leucine proline-enriched proteoglycan (leprecan)